jgi:hypothetical protein
MSLKTSATLRWVLVGVIFLVLIWMLTPKGKTTDFAGMVSSVETEGKYYIVTATQELSEFTVTIVIPMQKVKVKASSGTSQRLEIKKGDLITLNYRNKPEKVNGVWYATSKGKVLVWSLAWQTAE